MKLLNSSNRPIRKNINDIRVFQLLLPIEILEKKDKFQHNFTCNCTSSLYFDVLAYMITDVFMTTLMRTCMWIVKVLILV